MMIGESLEWATSCSQTGNRLAIFLTRSRDIYSQKTIWAQNVEPLFLHSQFQIGLD